jgi:hypothetical protein
MAALTTCIKPACSAPHTRREIVARLRAVTSVVIRDASFLRNLEHRELFISSLRLATGETK